MTNKESFTLLELIIVIIVIGILASIALPRYMRVTERARVGEAKNMLSTIRNSQFRYYAQYLSYTSDLNRLDIETGTGKYFKYSGYISFGGRDFVGWGVRTDVDRGSEYTDYRVGIDENGTLMIEPGYEYLL